MINMEQIGSAFCPQCNERVQITNLEAVTIQYPKGANKMPVARVKCEDCGTLIISGCEWEDAVKFDQAGAQTDGFSFARSPAITEEEIIEFVSNMDSEITQFLKDSHAKTR